MTDPMQGTWPRLDEGATASAQMIQWYAPKTYKVITETALLSGPWVEQHDAEVARAAAEKAWDEGWDAAPVEHELGETIEPNPYRADAES